MVRFRVCFGGGRSHSVRRTTATALIQRRSLNAQIVDCAWDYGVSGCGGGDYQPVFTYVVDNGGIALEQVRPSGGLLCGVYWHGLVGQWRQAACQNLLT